MVMPLKIAIIGAGPAGSTLARLLQQSPKDVRVTICESEPALDFRSQGGSLDLHDKTGQAALRAAGLWDEFLKYARYDGEAIKISDKKLLCYVNERASANPRSNTSIGSRPEIDRPRLRQILYEGLHDGTVRWDHKLQHVDADGLHFTDGNVESGFDLVVGADGAWSKVRPYLSDAKPYYSGIGGHMARIPDAQENEPDLFALVNRGSCFGFSDGRSIMSQYMGDGSVNVSTWRVLPEQWQTESGFDVHDAAAVKANVLRDYADWDERLVALTQKTNGPMTPRSLYMLPIGHKWEHKPGVTIIGDAAHLMTPFAGEGVNLAMEDSLELAKAILAATSVEHLDERIARFEQNMFARATATQRKTDAMMTAMFFTPGAPRNGIERYILQALHGALGTVGTWFATPLVYAWFFVFKLIHR